MNALKEALRKIPGTTVFDADHSRRGYALNMWCMTLQFEANRTAFKTDERGYIEKHSLEDGQCQAILDRDYNRLLELGGNIYFLSKLAAVDGHSFQQIAARMCGVPVEEFQQMMIKGGRKPDVSVKQDKEQ
ncbi:protocatechuate 4,5-dioxygenase subunit alpha [Neopusillimonas maritima]|jgi:protocatechuate 4,5-dioxygenase alpha chain|uniref:Protocatechuate 4,5-dioxygenase subunit alpha n=1 Tax=Neopusillimonas maritima TaxID=2026239 RepID=A0ABX9MXI0_9BURK|nr:protocatechuate 4,5-dioxygenase subunit alpha [Neopusillimonas maritima]RII83243.1 protocatechuate 4,5-dioxygenase subunit alpha [Neopusillimonas maritima]